MKTSFAMYAVYRALRATVIVVTSPVWALALLAVLVCINLAEVLADAWRDWRRDYNKWQNRKSRAAIGGHLD